VNRPLRVRLDTLGGWRQSGIGREGGVHSLESRGGLRSECVKR
jgi:acyl-CoA reductase-like NAD-dependent aldehyde dehydrogenase